MNQCRYLALACLYENLNKSKFFFFPQNPTISVKNPQLFDHFFFKKFELSNISYKSTLH